MPTSRTMKPVARLTATGPVRVFRLPEADTLEEARRRASRVWVIVGKLRSGQSIEVTLQELDDLRLATHGQGGYRKELV